MENNEQTTPEEQNVDTPVDKKVDTPEEQKGESDDQIIQMTQEEFNKAIEKRFKKYQKDLEEKEAENKRLSSMTDDERMSEEVKKAQEERDSALKEVQSAQSEKKRLEQSIQVTKELSSKNITADETTLAMLVTDDEDVTKKNVDTFVKLINDQASNLTEAKLKGNGAPKASTATSESEFSVSDIIAKNLNNK